MTNDLIEITHVKGFKISKILKESKKINFDSLCDILECPKKVIDYEENDAFHVDSKLCIQKRNISKKLAFTFDKRKINDDFTTLPWGYRTNLT